MRALRPAFLGAVGGGPGDPHPGIGEVVGRMRLHLRPMPLDLTPLLDLKARPVSVRSALAQLVEQLTVNQRVAGSSPAGGAISRYAKRRAPALGLGRGGEGGDLRNGHRLEAIRRNR